MRYIVNSNNYVTAISFGTEIVYNDCVCVEYTGMVPSGWKTLEDWYFDEGDKLWRWQIIDGELTLDPYATAPGEGDWTKPDLQYKFVYPATYTQYVSPDSGYDGLSEVIVYPMDLQSKTIDPTTSKQTIKPDNGYDGLKQVVVNGYTERVPKVISGSITLNGDTEFSVANSTITEVAAVFMSRNDKKEIEDTHCVLYDFGAYINNGYSTSEIGWLRYGSSSFGAGIVLDSSKLSVYASGDGTNIEVSLSGGGVAGQSECTLTGTYSYMIIGF